MANISHELKTPLAVVSSQVEMLEIAGDKIDRSYYYSSIHEELDKMSRMVGELLDFSMLDNQMSSMEMSRVNVSEMIEYLLLRYDAMFRKNEIKVEQEIEKNCFAYGNRMYLERAVNNYLMNAFQHTEQGKRIRITLKKEKSRYAWKSTTMESRLKKSRWSISGTAFTQLPRRRNQSHLRMKYVTLVLDFLWSERSWINIKEAAEPKIWRTECCSGFNFRKSGIWENEKVE